MKSENPKEAVQNIKNIDINKIPRNITDYLIFNKIGTREDIKILFGLKAIKINGNASTGKKNLHMRKQLFNSSLYLYIRLCYT